MKLIYLHLIHLIALQFSFGQAAKECASVQEVEDEAWPELWRLTTPDPSDPQAENKGDVVDPTVLANAGVKYWKFDPSVYPYPNVSVPWEPPTDDQTLDPQLGQFRRENGYDYADIITVTSLVPSFWDEHLHVDPTIRYILNGSGYFDLRDTNDEWVRMYVQPGDLMEWPSGIFHRFTVDGNNFITAMRLFQGSPIWTAYPRSSYQLNETAVEDRTEYEDTYINCVHDPPPADGNNETTAAPSDAATTAAPSGVLPNNNNVATAIMTFLMSVAFLVW